MVGKSRLLYALLLEVDGHSVTSYRMIVSVPTPYPVKLLGFNCDEEPIIDVDDIGYQMDTSLHVYNPTHGEFENLGIEAIFGSLFIGQFNESSEIIRLGSQHDNPLVDHGRDILERLTGADMQNAMQMVAARHELHRSMAEKEEMINNYRQM
ncbi:hypothetical protein Tco_0445838 [Tanacetum coccineum]